MDIITAKMQVMDFYDISVPTEEERFQYTEAMEYLLEREKNPSYMLEYGGYYYEMGRFDLALKYYQMAADLGYVPAHECLGYIWYYGRTGQKDYQKAFEHFQYAMKHGNLVATYKIADMYKNGYYVEKNEAKYVEIMEDLYEQVKGERMYGGPKADIFVRIARIRVEQGRKEEAIALFLRAKEALVNRLAQNGFWGYLNVMEGLIHDLYQLTELDEEKLDLYDLYELLQKPSRVTFLFRRKQYEIESINEDGDVYLFFEGKAYMSMSDLLQRAKIGEYRLTTISTCLKNFRVE